MVIDPEAPALVYLTSGSTGRPKAIAHTQATLVRQLWAQVAISRITIDDSVAVLFPLAFLGSFVTFGGALLVGAVACLYDVADLGIDPMPDWILDRGISQLFAAPSVLHALVGTMDRRGTVVPRLRHLAFGGEEFSTGDLQALRHAFPSARFFNAYGS